MITEDDLESARRSEEDDVERDCKPLGQILPMNPTFQRIFDLSMAGSG